MGLQLDSTVEVLSRRVDHYWYDGQRNWPGLGIVLEVGLEWKEGRRGEQNAR